MAILFFTVDHAEMFPKQIWRRFFILIIEETGSGKNIIVLSHIYDPIVVDEYLIAGTKMSLCTELISKEIYHMQFTFGKKRSSDSRCLTQI